MKKLFAFCLLASFALATNSFAGPKKAVTFLGDPDCSGFNLNSCPAHATCDGCRLGFASTSKYKMTGCESGYSKVGNKCIKEKIPHSGTHKIDEVITSKPITRTITTKRKK